MKLFAMALAIVCGIAAALFVIGFALLSVFYEQPEALRAAGRSYDRSHLVTMGTGDGRPGRQQRAGDVPMRVIASKLWIGS